MFLWVVNSRTFCSDKICLREAIIEESLIGRKRICLFGGDARCTCESREAKYSALIGNVLITEDAARAVLFAVSNKFQKEINGERVLWILPIHLSLSLPLSSSALVYFSSLWSPRNDFIAVSWLRAELHSLISCMRVAAMQRFTRARVRRCTLSNQKPACCKIRTI